MEAGPRIRANEIGIGSIDTPLSRAYRRRSPRAVDLAGELAIPPTPRLRLGVAAAAVFLLSDEASYITGQFLTVDGGFTAAK